MQSDASQAATRPSFSLSEAIYSIATGEPAPKNTALDLCFEAESVLALVIASIKTASPDDIEKSVRAAASLIEAASFLNDIEEN